MPAIRYARLRLRLALLSFITLLCAWAPPCHISSLCSPDTPLFSPYFRHYRYTLRYIAIADAAAMLFHYLSNVAAITLFSFLPPQPLILIISMPFHAVMLSAFRRQLRRFSPCHIFQHCFLLSFRFIDDAIFLSSSADIFAIFAYLRFDMICCQPAFRCLFFIFFAAFSAFFVALRYFAAMAMIDMMLIC